MENLSSPLPKRLKEARKAKGLSQKQLGILAGIDPSSASPRLNQYEKGIHSPDLNVLRQIAKVLNVPLPYFFCDNDEMAKTIKLLPLINQVDLKPLIDVAMKKWIEQ